MQAKFTPDYFSRSMTEISRDVGKPYPKGEVTFLFVIVDLL